MMYLDNIIKYKTSFLGATGKVDFNNDTGDREYGFFMFGNFKINDDNPNGIMEYIGYYIKDPQTGEIIGAIDDNLIIWPDEFVSKGKIPQSSQIEILKTKHLNKDIVIGLSVCIFISIIIIICYIVLMMINKEKKAIRSSSWKLNIVSCIGGILMLISTFLFGFDSSDINKRSNLTFLCNFRHWLLVLSFSILFIPFFLKTYRIARIFEMAKNLKSADITDIKLIIFTLGCTLFDIILLTILASTMPFKYEDFDGKSEVIDPLERIQYIYGDCICVDLTTNERGNMVFFVVIGIWKGIELLFGCYVGILVSQIIGFKEIARLDETGSQIIAIFLTGSLMCIFVSTLVFGRSGNYNIDFGYVLVVVISLLIVNITLFTNIGLRLYNVVILKREEEYLQSAEEKMSSWFQMMHENTKKIGKKQGWIRENSRSQSSKAKSGLKLSAKLSAKFSNSNSNNNTTGINIASRSGSVTPMTATLTQQDSEKGKNTNINNDEIKFRSGSGGGASVKSFSVATAIAPDVTSASIISVTGIGNVASDVETVDSGDTADIFIDSRLKSNSTKQELESENEKEKKKKKEKEKEIEMIKEKNKEKVDEMDVVNEHELSPIAGAISSASNIAMVNESDSDLVEQIEV